MNSKPAIMLRYSYLFIFALACRDALGAECTAEDDETDHAALLQVKVDRPPLPHKYVYKYVPGEDGTYSQNYQDVWAMHLAQHNNWLGKPGFFLDLGAYDGTHCSNSALLEKRFGWNGICVEPFPKGFENRRCVVVSRALTDKDGELLQFHGADQSRSLNLPSARKTSEESITSITMSSLLACVNGTAPSGTSCHGVSRQLEVPPFINFASLDVEGNELWVLDKFPWDKTTVGAWIIENAVDSGRSAEKQKAVRNILRSKGYLRVPVKNPGVDEYFVLPKFWTPSLAAKEWREHPDGYC
jgi:hypothetical protein